MPELPEAETIVRGLRASLPGRTVRELRVLRADVLADGPEAFRKAVTGRCFGAVERRGKNVVLLLDEDRRIVVNLGMTGSLLPDPPEEGSEAPTHPAVIFALDEGRLVYDDVRRFGRLEVMGAEAFRAWSAGLGPEPLADEFTTGALGEALGASRSAVRDRLLDQARVAGVGNIYANEALFRARIHPGRPCRSLSTDEVRRLHASLRAVLRSALDAGGTTIRDYRNADGQAGSFGPRLLAYGRDGGPCPRCQDSIRRAVFTSRSAFFCPHCQPEASDEAPPGTA